MHALWWMCLVLTGQTAGVALLLRAAAPLAGLERSAAAAPAPSQASDLLTEQRRTQLALILQKYYMAQSEKSSFTYNWR